MNWSWGKSKRKHPELSRKPIQKITAFCLLGMTLPTLCHTPLKEETKGVKAEN